MDISSEMIHSLLPLYLSVGLGVGALTIGLIEGLAESTALVVKVFSGVLSDKIGKRKPLALFGYGLGAASKPFFALASSAGLIVTARVIDRIGKGIRGAPRDALVADLAPPELRGAAFGLRQGLDTVGAFLGPLLAIGLMMLWADDFRAVFWVAVIPAVLAVVLLAVGVREPPHQATSAVRNPLSRTALRALDVGYWRVVLLGTVFSLARFSEAFLVLRVQQDGLPLALAPLVLIAMNLVYAGGAYPLGALSDRLPRQHLLMAGLGVLICADLALAAGGNWNWLGIALWGLHMSMTQGVLAAMVADTAPVELRGTAFGVFNLASGVAVLLASVIAGGLWQFVGADYTFIAGAGFAAVATLLLRASRRRTALPA
jgi:MFS family permease